MFFLIPHDLDEWFLELGKFIEDVGLRDSWPNLEL